jgi:pimeloyl-ACP methyl ester carboxylesterase
LTQRKERRVTAADGRTLGVCEWGLPDGRPVFGLHGTPGSRLGRHYDPSVYERAGVRLVTYDRPGYGVSERQLGRRVVDGAHDVSAVADALDLDQFAVMGGSGGGPHALACGALLGERVEAIAAVVCPAPWDAPGIDPLAGQSPGNREEFGAALRGRAALEELLAGQAASIAANPWAIVTERDDELPAEDIESLERPERFRVFAEALGEAVAQGAGGWVDDDLAFVQPWGFDLDQISAPVSLWQGRKDSLIPAEHGMYLAAAIPDARIHWIETGHLAMADQMESILADLTAARTG